MRIADLAPGKLAKALEHLELGARVERRRRLVQDQQLGVAHVGARDRDLLPLAAGEVDAAAEALAEDLVVAVRQPPDDAVGEAPLRRGGDPRAIESRIDAADGDVLARGQVVAHEILEDDADVPAQRLEVVVAQIVAVQHHVALVGIVEAREQLDQRGLAGAVLAHQRQHFAGAQREVEVAHRPALGARVAEADVVEGEALADRLRERQRTGARAYLRLDLEEREEVVEIERLPGDVGKADQETLEQRAQAAERSGEERQVADREFAVQRAQDDVRVGHVIGDRADRREHAAHRRAADGERAVGGEEARGERSVALDQERVEAEDLDLLRGLHAGAGLADVVELAALGRALVVERVAARIEVRLADERRHQRDRQQHDEPGRVHDQPRGEADDRHGVLRLAEQLAHQRRAPGRLAPRALEAVLQVGVLEVLEVQRRRMLHQAQARLVAEFLRQQRIDQRHGAPHQVGADRQCEFEGDQAGEPRQRTVEHEMPADAGGAVRRDQAHHLVDDELADVERHHRQQRARDAQHAGGEREHGARAPHHPQERRQVAQRADALAQRARAGQRCTFGFRVGAGHGHARYCAQVRRRALGGADQQRRKDARRHLRPCAVAV